MYGHVEKLAEAIKEGASSVEGVEAKLWQVGDAVSFIFCPILYMKDKPNMNCLELSQHTSAID